MSRAVLVVALEKLFGVDPDARGARSETVVVDGPQPPCIPAACAGLVATVSGFSVTRDDVRRDRERYR
jgi:hypothetical protein